MQGMDGARTLVDPDNGNYYEANAGAVVVLDARTGCSGGDGVEPELQPQRLHLGQRRPVLPGPQQAADQPRAQRRTRPARRSRRSRRSRCCRAASSPEAPGHLARDYPDGCFHFGNDEERCNAGDAVLGTVDLPARAHGVERRLLLHGRATSSGTPTATRARPSRAAPARPRRRQAARRRSTRSATRSSTPRSTYGFGEPTGIGLGDQPGVIPNHEFRVKLNPNDDDSCSSGAGATAPASRSVRATCSSRRCSSPTRTPRSPTAARCTSPAWPTRSPQSSAGLPAGQLGQPVTTIDPLVKRTTGLTPEVRAPIEAGLAGVVNPTGAAPRPARSATTSASR